MSLCVVRVTNNDIYIAADSRASVFVNDELYKSNDDCQKIYQIHDKVIFASGVSALIDEIVLEYQNQSNSSVIKLNQIAQKKMKELRPLHEDLIKKCNDCYLSLVFAEYNTLFRKPLLHVITEDYKDVMTMVIHGNEVKYEVFGTRSNEAREEINKVISSSNVVDIKYLYSNVYNALSFEGIGGILTVYNVSKNGINTIINSPIKDNGTIKEISHCAYIVHKLKNDKIIFSKDNFETYYTLLSANGLYLESDNCSRCVITPEYGIQIDKKASGGQWDNVFYVDTDGNLIIDGGWIKLLTANHKNQIFIDPENGIRIQSNSGTAEFTNWEDRFYVDTNGNLIAKQLRTSSDSADYVTLREQYIDFWNGGLKKLQLGFTDGFPYMMWGAGSGNLKNIMEMYKNTYGFYMQFSTDSNDTNGITFLNNDSEYPDGVIKFNGVVDFSGATVIGI